MNLFVPLCENSSHPESCPSCQKGMRPGSPPPPFTHFASFVVNLPPSDSHPLPSAFSEIRIHFSINHSLGDLRMTCLNTRWNCT